MLNADGSDRKLLTTSLDRQCGPYPDMREPLWDGDRIVFGVEDGGNVHVYGVAADGSSAPELIVGGEQVISGYDVRDGKLAYAASTSTTMGEVYIGTEARRVTNVGDAFGARVSSPSRNASPRCLRTATRWTRGSCGLPASSRARATPRC